MVVSINPVLCSPCTRAYGSLLKKGWDGGYSPIPPLVLIPRVHLRTLVLSTLQKTSRAHSGSFPFPDDPQDDELLAEVLEDQEQVGEALPSRGLIEFRREPIVNRRSRQLGVRERVFQLQP